MNDVWNWIRGAIATLGGVLGWLLGGGDGFLYTLIAFCVLDYITGVIAAGVEKKLDSHVGFKGIFDYVLKAFSFFRHQSGDTFVGIDLHEIPLGVFHNMFSVVTDLGFITV